MPSIGPRIQITGETEYRQALMRVISTTKALNSEMDLMVAKFRDSDTSMSKNKQLFEQLQRNIAQSKKQYEAFSDTLAKATEQHEKANKRYEDAKNRIVALNQENKKLKEYLDSVEKSGNKNSETWKQLTDKIAKNEEEAKKLEDSLPGLAKEIDRTAKNMEDWATKTNQAAQETVELEKKAEEAGNTLKHFGEDASQLGEQVSGVGKALSTYITTPLLALGTASVKASSDFTDGMAKIYTIATEGQKPMSEMRSELEQLSKEMGFSLDDLTEATYQAVSASVDTTKAVGFVEDASKLARAGFTTTTGAVDLLTTAINAYGMEAEDASYISDLLLQTQNKGKTIIDELAASMGTVIPTAAAYNVSLEDLSAAYIVMTKRGINTARSTTFLNSMFTELERESSDVSKILKDETGKSMAELMESGWNLGEVLQLLYEHVGRDGEEFAKLWKNVRAGRGGLALVQNGIGEFNEALEALNQSAGQTDYALEMLETPGLKAKRALNQLKVISVELGDALIGKLYPMFEKGVEWLSEFSQKVMEMDERAMESVAVFGIVTAAIGPALLGMGKLITVVGKLAKWFSKLTPIGMATMAITAMTVAYAELGAAAMLMQEQREAQIRAEYGLSEEMRNSISTMDELKKSHEELIEEQKNNLQATDENVAVIEELVKQYNGLIDSEGNVVKGKEELADTILTKLAEAMGIEYNDVVALIEENGKFGKSIEENIQQIKKRAEMAAYEEMYTEAIKRKTVAERENAKQVKALEEQHVKVEQAQRNYDKALEEYNKHVADGTAKTGGYEDALQTATTQLAIAKAAEAELNGAIADTKQEIKDASFDVGYYSNKMSGDVKGSTEDAVKAIEQSISNVEKVGTKWSKTATNSMRINGYDIGMYATKGFAEGMDDYSYLAKQAAKRVASAASRQMRVTLDEHSPSKETEEIGEFFGQGFINGMLKYEKPSMNAGKLLAQGALNMANGMYNYSPNGFGTTYNTSKTVTAPISVNVNVNGEVGGDYNRLADIVAERIATTVAQKEGVFA